MTVQNNCNSCKYRLIESTGWCYMFSKEPKEKCVQHTYVNVGTVGHVDHGKRIGSYQLW